MKHSRENFEAAENEAAPIIESGREFRKKLPRSENPVVDFILGIGPRGQMMAVKEMVNDLTGKSRKMNRPQKLKDLAEKEARALDERFEQLKQEAASKGREYASALEKLAQFQEQELGMEGDKEDKQEVN